MDYNAFISYSHGSDGSLAPKIHRELQRFAKPWWRRRALRVFCDNSNLSASPHLWASIESALSNSEWLVLLCSPAAARSEWVNREVGWWLLNRDPTRILPVVTAGEIAWDGKTRTFDQSRSDCIPTQALSIWSDEPRWVDLRWVTDDQSLNARDVRFRDAIADVAAAVHGVAKDELASEEVRQHRRTIRTAVAAGIALLILATSASIAGLIALRERDESERRSLIAQSQALASEAVDEARVDINRALILGVEAVKMHDSIETRRGLLSTLASAGSLVTQRNAIPEGLFGSTPDGLNIISLSSDGELRNVDSRTGEVVIKRQVDTANSVKKFEVVSNDVVALMKESSFRLYEVETLEPVTGQIRSSGQWDPRYITFSPDGDRFATLSVDGAVVLIGDASTGLIVNTFRIGEIGDLKCGTVWSLEFGPNEQLFMACDGRPFLLDVSSLPRARYLKSSFEPVAIGEFSRDGTLLVVYDVADRNIALFDTNTSRLIPGLSLDAAPRGLALSEDGSQIAIVDIEGRLRLWTVEQVEENRVLRLAASTSIGDAIAIYFRSHRMPWQSSTRLSRIFAVTNSSIQEWNIDQRTVTGEIVRSGVFGVVVNSRRKLAYVPVSLTPPGFLIDEVSILTGKASRQVRIPIRGQIRDAVTSKDGSQILVLSSPEAGAMNELDVSIVSADDGKFVHRNSFRFPEGWYSDNIGAILWSGDRRWIALLMVGGAGYWGSLDVSARVLIRDLEKNETLEVPLPFSAHAIEWSSLNELVIAGRKLLVFVDPDSLEVTARIGIEQCGFCDVSDVNAGFDGFLTFTSGKSVRIVDGLNRTLSGEQVESQTLELLSSALSPDGSLIAALDSAGNLQLWDRKSGRSLVSPLRAHASGVGVASAEDLHRYLQFLEDGTLVTWSSSTEAIPGQPILGQYEILRWRFDSKSLAARACALIYRRYSDDEWQNYIDREGQAQQICD